MVEPFRFPVWTKAKIDAIDFEQLKVDLMKTSR
jgi:hypothetical protein